MDDANLIIESLVRLIMTTKMKVNVTLSKNDSFQGLLCSFYLFICGFDLFAS